MTDAESTDIILRGFVAKKEKEIRKYHKQESLAFWQASMSGTKEDYDKIATLTTNYLDKNNSGKNSFQVDKLEDLNKNVLLEREDFEFVRKIRSSGLVKDSLLKRQLDILYLRFVESRLSLQQNNELINTQYGLLHKIQNHSLIIDGVPYKKNEIDSLRKQSFDPLLYEQVYLQKKKFVAENYADIIKLVKLRNKYAQDCGYDNFYDFMLSMYEESNSEVQQLLVQLDTITREEYHSAKKVTDMFLSRRFEIDKNEIMLWHYYDERYVFIPPNFSQKLDKVVSRQTVVGQVADYFKKTGLSIDDVLAVSSINNPAIHTQSDYFIPVDNKDDLRLMTNVDNTYQGLKVFIHLSSYAVYYKYINAGIPYLLTEPNVVALEGVATLFSNYSMNCQWLNNQFGISSHDSLTYRIVCKHAYQIEKLFRSRNFLTIALFEKELYTDPDQNLGDLWWTLNEKILGFKRPEFVSEYDWALEDYFVLTPVWAQNKIFAELFAAQLQASIEKELQQNSQQVGSINENSFLGDFLKKNLFNYGNVLPWNELIVKATGEPLSAGYFYESIVNMK